MTPFNKPKVTGAHFLSNKENQVNLVNRFNLNQKANSVEKENQINSNLTVSAKLFIQQAVNKVAIEK